MISLELIALVALLAAFIVLLVKKWGWAEWMQVHGEKYMSRLFGCDLCMSFWAAVLICMVLACFNGDCHMVFVPLFTTPLTRMLV